jgi:hypothetical protein
MSVIKNNLNRFSSFHSFKNFNNKQNNFQDVFNNKKNSSKFGLFNFNLYKKSNYSRDKNNEINTLDNSPPSLFKTKEEEKQNFNKHYPRTNYKSLVKFIKTSFRNKYNNIYYKIKGNFLYNKNNNYLLYDYFKITDILENKRCALVANLNEFNIIYNKKELLIRFYKPKERYIIMKYLLNFIYKYDKLCYDEAKEITDPETKEEVIKTFYYITSEQYIYEHLFENDSFKGMQNLLKHVNLANKKASYDYSYLDMTKNASVSKENETIINTLKVINEYINNRTYLERKLIKNFPIENVPNIVPNYCPLGIKINILLNDYKIARKLIKIGNHEETKDLINKYKEEFSHHENKNTKQTLHDKKLFNIQENLEENESGKSDVNSETNVKKENSKYKNILTESMNDMSEASNKNESSNELKGNDIQNKITLYEFPNDFSNKRYDKDPETKDIENFLEKISNTPKRLNNNIHKNYINAKTQNKIINSTIQYKNNKFHKVKFKMEHLKLKSEFKNNEKDFKKTNFKFKNKLMKGNNDNNMILTPIKNRIPSAINNFRESTLKLKKRKLNNQNHEKNLINSPSFNNISSSNFNETNYISPNLSGSFKIHKKNNNHLILSKKNNSFLINHQLSKLNNYNINNYNKFTNNNNVDLYSIFKDTERFIEDSIAYKNKITLKRNIILRKFSTFFNKNIPNNNSKYYDLRLSSSKRYSSNSPNNSEKKLRKLFKKTDFEKLVFKMNKRLIISKKKESKSYTFEQILKNCEIYISKLN